METTPPRSTLSCKSKKLKTEIKKESTASKLIINAPVATNSKSEQDNDYSPMYFPTTQESNEDIDVLWDWHSPQSSERRRKKQKRLIPVQSPHVPMKRQSSNKNTNFDKLRDELRLLQEELAIPDESCLCVSPEEELVFKDNNHGDNHSELSKEQEHKFDEFDDFFDDGVDEQLVLFSQQIEDQMLKKENKIEAKPKETIFGCDNTDIDELINKYSKNTFDKAKDKNLDTMFSSFHNEKEVKMNYSTKNNKFTFQRTYSDDQTNKSPRNVIQTMSGKLELHRTKSFELESKKNLQVNIPKSKLEEIERNRLEAMAKLALKKKREINKNITTQILASQCSPEEIEKKRLQALAKLEARRLDEIVEKKRQEALKRLQANRMKKANLVKSTLTTRL